MLELEQQILEQNPQWRLVLERYIAEHDRSKKENPEHDGWVGRLTGDQQLAEEELSAEELAGIHGRLIALGLIRFQIADRTAGMRYQVTGVGRSVLKGSLANDDDGDSDADAGSDPDSDENSSDSGHAAAA